MTTYRKNTMNKLSLLMLIVSQCFGAIVYVRDGGSGSGTSWTDAYDDTPSTITRGDTVMIADGVYNGYTFNDAESGTDSIWVLKATVASHGTETGWDDSYGDGRALTGPLIFSTSNHVVDGITGGGIGNWTGFGIVCSSGVAGYILTVSSVSNIIIRHVETHGPDRTTEISQRSMYGNGSSHITVDSCYMYHSYKGCINLVNTDTILIQYSKFGPNGPTAEEDPPIHGYGNTFQNNHGLTFRYNFSEDMAETGHLSVVTDEPTDSMVDCHIYGNCFYETGLLTVGNSIFFAANATEVWKNFKFVNNTIFGLEDFSNIGIYMNQGTDGGDNIAKNNIWYANTASSFTMPAFIDHDYNYFTLNYNGAAPLTLTETNSQIDNDNPFADTTTWDFTLIGPTDAGEDLGAPFNVDMLGNTRGSDGVWDRGAFEYVTAGEQTNTKGVIWAY